MSSPVEPIQEALGDRYEVESQVGRGGMAAVYRARTRSDGTIVAVKVLDPDLAGSVGADRFLREIRIASNLKHPGILPLLDSGSKGTTLCYVMPFVDGESLRDRLTRESPLPIAEAIRIALEVGDALAYAHAQGVIHRDIKPDNIMLSAGRALVSDFGIARAIDQAGTEKLTETGLAVGTPTYMSPEQWLGGKVDGRSDLYALGCMLFEMLVGEPPFTGPTPQVIMARHSMEPVPSMRVARSTVSPQIEDVVRRALAKIPADRPASVAEFTAALRAAPHEATPAQMAVGVPLGAPAPAAAPIVTPNRRLRLVVVAVVALALVVAGGFWWRTRNGGGDDDKTRLVVLPFRNVGAAEDEYFAEGITEEITSRLSSVHALGVIARTSARQYRNSEKDVKEIGEELRVRYVLEGSIRWNHQAGTVPGVRISVRLIKVDDGTPLWSSARDFSLAQVFAVQASVAEAVVEALELAVLEPERRRMQAQPTANLTAYDYLLRGNSYYNRSWARSDVDSAALMYEKATEADAGFALAWAQLGKTHTWIHRLGFDETAERLSRARAAIDRAIQLDPNLPETHIAQGLYLYWGQWAYEKAIDEFSIARQLQPSNAYVYLQLGNIRRRQGLWDDAVREYEEAGKYDPRSHLIWFNIAHIKTHSRQHEQAEPYLDRVITLQPAFLDAYLLKAGVRFGGKGDVPGARRFLDSTETLIPPNTWRPLASYWLLGAMRIYKTPEERLRIARAGEYGLDSTTVLLARAEALRELGRTAESRATLDSAIVALEGLYVRTPRADWLSAALGQAYARAGRKAEALAAAKRARTLQSDALDGPEWIVNEAMVQLIVGDTAASLTNIETAISIPSPISVHSLRYDPMWAPLRDHPRFQAIIAKGSPRPAS